MLQGITNISTNTEFSEVKKDRRVYAKHRAYLNSDSSSDLIDVSPAFMYMSKLNWQIQKIDAAERNKISISFSVLGFLFKLTIDLDTLPLSRKIFLGVKKKLVYKTLDMVLSIPSTVREDETLEDFKLENLEILFTRIEYLVRTGKVNPLESKVSVGVYEDIIPGLVLEMQKILYAVLVFAEKLTSQNFLKNFTNNNGNVDNFRIEHVEIC